MSFSSNYNLVERGLHYLAFSAPIIQKVLADIENDLFKRELEAVQSSNEVFVTGLPRAGTTLLLELLYATGEFRTYTYRDMPFILSPLLWNRLSRMFRKAGKKQERAHGDGVEISFDSPEAFDEVIWLTYMGDKIVQGNTLSPVSAEDISDECETDIRNSVRKILALGEPAGNDFKELRYLSKNNANISRIDALRRLFPTSAVLIVFRHPLAHVSSLATQHEGFLDKHRDDVFSKKYMKWIGHFEFGENFKPINFSGGLDAANTPIRADDTFWLSYWSDAYACAMKHKTENVHFVDFDRLLENGSAYLEAIARSVGLKHADALVDAGKRLRSPTTRPMEHDRFPPDILSQAQDVYSQLQSIAIQDDM
jgi:hypothetical protein